MSERDEKVIGDLGAYCGVVGIGVDLRPCGGFDNHLEQAWNDPPEHLMDEDLPDWKAQQMSAEDRRGLADYMINLWTQYRAAICSPGCEFTEDQFREAVEFARVVRSDNRECMGSDIAHWVTAPGVAIQRCQAMAAALRAIDCSPFDALMGQIEGMRDRARQYAEESEAEQNCEEGHRHRSVEGSLNELLRLGKFFRENEEQGTKN